MRKNIRIYFEGGGDSRTGKDSLRRAMDGFLKPLKDLARSKGWGWNSVPGGGQDSTADAFINAARSYPNDLAILLIDSEEAPAYAGGEIPADGPKAHVANRTSRDLSQAASERIHLMVHCMEAWLCSDPEALAGFYGQHFNARALPNRRNLEEEPKADLYSKLNAASRPTSKGAYMDGKLSHSTKILPKVDPDKVRDRCPHAERFFVTLEDFLKNR